MAGHEKFGSEKTRKRVKRKGTIRKRIHGKLVSKREVANHTRRFCRKGIKTSYLLSLGIRA